MQNHFPLSYHLPLTTHYSPILDTLQAHFGQPCAEPFSLVLPLTTYHLPLTTHPFWTPCTLPAFAGAPPVCIAFSWASWSFSQSVLSVASVSVPPFWTFWTVLCRTIFHCLTIHQSPVTSHQSPVTFFSFWTPCKLILDSPVQNHFPLSYQSPVTSHPFWTPVALPAFAGDTCPACYVCFPLEGCAPSQPFSDPGYDGA